MPDPVDYRYYVYVDVAIFSLIRGELCALFISPAAQYPNGAWTLPATKLLDRQAVEIRAREYVEELTGVNPRDVLNIGGISDRGPEARTASMLNFTTIRIGDVKIEIPAETIDAQWFNTNALPALGGPHLGYFNHAMSRLKAAPDKILLASDMLPKVFTLSQLEVAVAAIAEKTFDNRNFRRQVIDSGVLVDTGEVHRGSHRPAKLYTLNTEVASAKGELS